MSLLHFGSENDGCQYNKHGTNVKYLMDCKRHSRVRLHN